MFRLSFRRGKEIREYNADSIILILYDTNEYVLFDPKNDIREIGSYTESDNLITLKPEYVNGERVRNKIEKLDFISPAA